MEQAESLRIIRLTEARNLCGLGKSSFYDRIKNGLLPPSISLGGRAVGWVECELNTVLKAMVSGKNEIEIKALVIELTEQRQLLV